MQELKSSGGVVYSVQTMLPEAGGQVGEVPVAMSWGCDLGPLVVAASVERSECLHRVAMCCEGRACEFMRPPRTPPFGERCSGGSRWEFKMFVI